MAREKVLSFVEARGKLSEILESVNQRGDIVVIAKRQRPIAVILGVDRYREILGARRNLKNAQGKRILRLRGLGSAAADIDQAVTELRRSRMELRSVK